ncbi:MAG: hypothetical protein ACYTBJ_04505 [Planctomycetota bacterium]|jgi:hypothetical protein
MFLLLPLLVFVILLFLGREELGFKWILILIGLAAALYAGASALGLSPYVFVAVLTLVDIILVIILFGGNVNIG